ncbi:MAG: class I SAM-dependent DNA methyltransferase [Bradyrhizobiaceae bacterium]|nr:class I SAM-dependent DNA methyltransferase [Bradyrhizobiaceae bacterium]
MRLSWNEIRVRAATFAKEWEGAAYEKGEAQSFYNEFFEIFGVTRRRVASFEEPVKKLDGKHGFIDLFWKGVLLVEQKSAGGNLTKAKKQALDYFPGLKEAELPRHILVSDFQTFELYDLDEGNEVKFALKDLPKKVEHFGFILGVEKRTFHDQDPVNIEASELVGELHDQLKDAGYVGHDLERFLVRLVFCLFADDTGIFEPRGIFYDLLDQRTRVDGSDVGPMLSQLFEVLNTPVEKRLKNLDEDLQKFPYVNGELFEHRLGIPAFDAKMRKKLLEVCDFAWDAISPAIFGSLFQSVMNAKERRASGGHYTIEKNILKVIQPLFMDELRSEFVHLRARRDSGRRKALEEFQKKLGTLKFFDPACGCGNFLIISYRELRELEIEVLREIHPKGQTTFLDVSLLSVIDVNQFYGIEIFEFPSRIAEVALWMMDHIMNNKLSLEFGDHYARIPLKTSPHIHNADALETNWNTVLPVGECSYVLGNPPFVGAKYQTDVQRAQVRRIANLGGSGGTLDYVTAWFIKAGEYIQGVPVRIGFVATNSITQGEQVAQLWPILFQKLGLEIWFAHRTFAWGSEARGKARVHVVILGITRREDEPKEKRLFSYSSYTGDAVESRHSSLSPYLIDASKLTDRHLVCVERSRSLMDVPKMITGTQPIDNGHLIFDDSERAAFILQEPAAERFLRPFLGTEEFVNGIGRWILALQEATPQELRAMPHVAERLRLVREFRRKSKRKSTLKIADFPAKFNVETIPDRPFLAVPEVSSENREYIPIGWLSPPIIPSNKLRLILDANLWHFAVLTSRMHMAWTQIVGGRLESRFQYSVGINYNCFPWPVGSEAETEKIRRLGQGILDARERYTGSTLADLYDADVMKDDLRSAHRALDDAVDRLYRKEKFQSDRERVEHLFGLYEKLVAPLTAASKAKRKGRKRVSAAEGEMVQ